MGKLRDALIPKPERALQHDLHVYQGDIAVVAALPPDLYRQPDDPDTIRAAMRIARLLSDNRITGQAPKEIVGIWPLIAHREKTSSQLTRSAELTGLAIAGTNHDSHVMVNPMGGTENEPVKAGVYWDSSRPHGWFEGLITGHKDLINDLDERGLRDNDTHIVSIAMVRPALFSGAMNKNFVSQGFRFGDAARLYRVGNRITANWFENLQLSEESGRMVEEADWGVEEWRHIRRENEAMLFDIGPEPRTGRRFVRPDHKAQLEVYVAARHDNPDN